MPTEQKLGDIIEQTIIIVEGSDAFNGKQLSDKVITELNTLLREYLHESLTPTERLRRAECWGGGVWDRLYHYHEQFKPVLVANYYEMQEAAEHGGRVSPDCNHFPYQELSSLCVSEVG